MVLHTPFSSMATDNRGKPVGGIAESRPRHTSSPVSALLAGLQAAHASRNFLSSRTHKAAESSSPSRSPERERGDTERERFAKSRLPRASLTKSLKADSALSPGEMSTLSSEGFLLDMHKLLRESSMILDVFKGSLMVIMATSNVIVTMSSTTLRSHSYASLVICNTAATLCFVGLLISFGFSCYGQYLHEWPDPAKDLTTLRLRVLRAVSGPVLGAWVCNFVWCFICLKNEFTQTNLFDVFTFSKVFGSGPDFLCSFSLDLALVYALWRPIMRLLEEAQKADGQASVGIISQLTPETRRNLTAAAITFCPLLLTLHAVSDCTRSGRWVQWFLVCDKREIDTASLAALPHLMDFGVGILVAACWHRFLADLRPYFDGGPTGGLSILPMQALRKWSLLMLGSCIATLVLFVPLGQVWLYTDLSVVQMATPFGQLVRGYSNGPSMLWLLATLWPVAMWASFIMVLVTLRGTVFGYLLKWPLGWLEHLGANVLFYLVLTDMCLAGMFRGFQHVDPFPFDSMTCIASTALIFLIGRFIHFICRSARK